MNYVRDDIINANCDYILQQCNCLTIKSLGLSKYLEDKFPYANVYSNRKQLGNRNLSVVDDRDIPGTYKQFYDSNNELNKMYPTIVALFCQWRPGNVNSHYFNNYPNPNPYQLETYEQRLEWFKNSLYSFGNYVYTIILKYNYTNKVKIAIPYKIGCGLAGGNWNDYKSVIENFSEYYTNIITLTIYIK